MSADLITDYGQQFSTTWPAVARLLRRRLLRGGVAEAIVDDVVQEAALVALDREVPFTSADELLAWTTVVARRLAVADHRRTSRLSVVADVADIADVAGGAVTGADDAALAKVALATTLDAIGRLSATDRAALAPVDSTALSRAEAVRLNVRRHRARSRLRALVAAASAVAIVSTWVRLRSPRRIATVVAAATTATLSIIVLPHTWSDDDRYRRTGGPTSSERHSHDAATSPEPASTAVADTVASGARDSAVGRARPADAPPPRPDPTAEAPVLPRATVEIPTGNGDAVQIDAAPDQPAALSVCVALGSASERCLVTLPVPATPLDGLRRPSQP